MYLLHFLYIVAATDNTNHLEFYAQNAAILSTSTNSIDALHTDKPSLNLNCWTIKSSKRPTTGTKKKYWALQILLTPMIQTIILRSIMISTQTPLPLKNVLSGKKTKKMDSEGTAPLKQNKHQRQSKHS